MIISDTYLKAFVQNNSEYYLPQLEDRSAIRFNYAALIFGALWFLHRKMRLYGLVFFAITIVALVLTYNMVSFLPLLTACFIALGVLGMIHCALGLVANRVYIAFVRNQIASLSSSHSNETYLLNSLQNRGGTSHVLDDYFIP